MTRSRMWSFVVNDGPDARLLTTTPVSSLQLSKLLSNALWYVFALGCMPTLPHLYNESNGWYVIAMHQ